AVFFLAEDLRVVTDDGGFRERTRAATDTRRFLFTEGRPAFAAKNRFGMPEKVPLPLDFDFSNLAQYWAKPEQSQMQSSTVLDTAFDVENEEGTPPRELLPAGKYKAQIVTAVVGPTKNAKGQAVNLTWTVIEGEFENRLVFQNILIQHESQDAQRFGRQKFKDVCSACGIT